jgi:hypothetical protein
MFHRLQEMMIIDSVKLRLHRDIVADPVLHGLVLNLYLNGEQYPHRVQDYFPMHVKEAAELVDLMRRHIAEEDKHSALYIRAIEKLEQPVMELPMNDIYNEVIRAHTPVSFAIAPDDDADGRRSKLAHFFAHLHYLEKRIARSLEYHVEACANAATSYPEKVVGMVLKDEWRHVDYTGEAVAYLLPARVAAEVMALHRRAERRANLDFSAGQLGGLLRNHAARFPRFRGAGYRGCASLLRGVLSYA